MPGPGGALGGGASGSGASGGRGLGPCGPWLVVPQSRGLAAPASLSHGRRLVPRRQAISLSPAQALHSSSLS